MTPPLHTHLLALSSVSEHARAGTLSTLTELDSLCEKVASQALSHLWENNTRVSQTQGGITRINLCSLKGDSAIYDPLESILQEALFEADRTCYITKPLKRAVKSAAKPIICEKVAKGLREGALNGKNLKASVSFRKAHLRMEWIAKAEALSP